MNHVSVKVLCGQQSIEEDKHSTIFISRSQVGYVYHLYTIVYPTYKDED